MEELGSHSAVPAYGPDSNATRKAQSAPWSTRDWGSIVCEAVTVTALVAILVSLVGGGNAPHGPDLLPAGTGPRDAFAACARFVGGEAPSAASRAHMEALQWARLADGRFRVRGLADSPSPLGELHRTYYQCDLVQLQPGRWSLDSVAVTTQGAGLDSALHATANGVH
jgi:hypothetical protein